MLISIRCIHGFMSNLIKKSWKDTTLGVTRRIKDFVKSDILWGGIYRLQFAVVYFIQEILTTHFVSTLTSSAHSMNHVQLAERFFVILLFLTTKLKNIFSCFHLICKNLKVRSCQFLSIDRPMEYGHPMKAYTALCCKCLRSFA